MKHAVQLVTYADRLAGDLSGVDAWLRGPMKDVFAGVHILPFYRPFDGADAGFDPEDHTQVDERLGTWADLARIATQGDVMADLIVNHMSVASPQFRSFLESGDASPYSGMFLTLASVFPNGATEDELLKIYRPGPKLPFTPFSAADGGQRLVWTTFTDQQADLDVHDPQSRAYVDEILAKMAASGVTVVRLDAVGFAVKKPGTSCFMIPETFTFIDDVTARAHALGMDVLVEVHSHYQTQVDISHHVDYIYDFALPPLLLHGLTAADVAPLAKWLTIRPANVVSVLDTHDGIGIIDAGPDTIGEGRAGLLTTDQLTQLVRAIHHNTGGESLPATGPAADNIDSEQINSTFFDALGRDVERYLLARAVQFFLPGVAQVYYVGLLGGVNDLELLRRTGVGRDINRAYYSDESRQAALDGPLTQRLVQLIRLRNTHAAFRGRFQWQQIDPAVLELRWVNGADALTLVADFAAGTFSLEDHEGQPVLQTLTTV